MSNLKQSKMELKIAGERLYRRLSSLTKTDPIDVSQVRQRSDWKAVISVLRSCIRCEMPTKSDMKLLNQALKAQSVSLTAECGKANAIKIAMWGQLWVTLYYLAYYVNCLADDPRLRGYEVIGICSQCDRVFMKHRADQEFCSGTCRFDAFAAKKGKTYFAEKSRNNRAVRRALNRKRRS